MLGHTWRFRAKVLESVRLGLGLLSDIDAGDDQADDGAAATASERDEDPLPVCAGAVTDNMTSG